MKRLTLVLAIVLAVSLLCGCVANKLDFWVEGICLVSDNGFVLLIVKDEPIVLHDRTDGGLFGGIQTGDRIRVLHDGIAESFPANAGVYRVEHLGKGSLAEVSPQLLNTLRDMGWRS